MSKFLSDAILCRKFPFKCHNTSCPRCSHILIITNLDPPVRVSECQHLDAFICIWTHNTKPSSTPPALALTIRAVQDAHSHANMANDSKVGACTLPGCTYMQLPQWSRILTSELVQLHLYAWQSTRRTVSHPRQFSVWLPVMASFPGLCRYLLFLRAV